jgi:hypothetical protein
MFIRRYDLHRAMRDKVCKFILATKNWTRIRKFIHAKYESGFQYIKAKDMQCSGREGTIDRRQGTWATETEVFAAAMMFGVDIWVYIQPKNTVLIPGNKPSRPPGMWTVAPGNGSAPAKSPHATCLWIWNLQGQHYCPITGA